jgi:hypothetical protein
LIPVNGFFRTFFDIEHLIITIQSLKNYQLFFKSNDNFNLIILSTQIDFCSKISSIDSDNFIQLNRKFFEEFSLPLNGPLSSKLSNYYVPIFPIINSNVAKETWIKKIYLDNNAFIIQSQKMPISFLTFNVGQQKSISNNDFIFHSLSPIIVVCLQEISFSMQAVIVGETNESEKWIKNFSLSAEKYGYEKLIDVNIGGVYLVVFHFRKFEFYINAVKYQTQRLGRIGIGAEKSAAIILLEVGKTKIAIAGCHLTSGAEKNKNRVKQFQLIYSLLKEMNAHYYIIMGDFNFRLETTRENAFELIKNSQIDQLLEFDQIKYLMKEIPELNEGKITFIPTYKFDLNSDVYDTSEKQRVPAYTDRVLYSTKPMTEEYFSKKMRFESDIIRYFASSEFESESHFSEMSSHPNYPTEPMVIKYLSNMDLKYSDHRPVELILNFDCLIENQRNLKLLQDTIIQKENEIIKMNAPLLYVDKTEVNVLKDDHIELKNIGNSFAEWYFDQIPNWVKFEPTTGYILPNHSQNVKFNVTGTRRLDECILINVKRAAPIILFLM